jgi:AraC-like DNA-binding protein
MGFRRDILIENLRLKDINPLLVGEHANVPGESYGPAFRSHYLLHFIFSGVGEFRTPRGEYLVKKGQIFVIRPKEITLYASSMDHPWHYSWVGFQTSIDLEAVLHDDVIDAPGCACVFRSLLESEHMNVGRELFVCGKIFEIIALLSVGLRQEKSAEYYVKVARDFMEAQLAQDLRVDALADSLNLSRVYFSRIFRQYTGKSPKQYIMDMRFTKAAELLASGVSPGEAAVQVGYDSVLSLSRMFRRRFGMSPSEYRKMRDDETEAPPRLAHRPTVR